MAIKELGTHHNALLVDDGGGDRHVMAGDVSEGHDLQLPPPDEAPAGSSASNAASALLLRTCAAMCPPKWREAALAQLRARPRPRAEPHCWQVHC